MIKKLFLLGVFALLMKIGLSQKTYSRVSIDLNKHSVNELVQSGIPQDAGYFEKNNYVAELSKTELSVLKQHGIEYHVIIEDMAAFYQKRNKKFEDQSIDEIMENSAKNYPIPDGFELGSMGGFYTTDQIYAELDSLRDEYPNLISSRAQVGSFTTHEGRELYWVRISDNPDVDEDEPEVLYTGLHHAREGNGMQALFYFMNYILEEYETNANIQQLLDNTELYFIPNVNPDGYTYNETTNPNGGGMWRKNRRDNGGEWGVDLNRNYGYNWGYDNNGSSPDPWSETYRGPSAFSEPETQAVKWFCEDHEFQLALNYHTYSNLLIYPWGYEEDLYTADSALFVELAEVLTAENNYTYGTGNQTVGYVTNGDACDWMYGEQSSKNKILPFTPEVGSGSDGFWPSMDRIIPLCEENTWANIALARFAGAYAVVEDLSQNLIGDLNPYIPFNIKRLGLLDGASYEVSFTPISDNVLSVGEPIIFSNMEVMDVQTDSIQLNLDPGIVSGDSFTFIIEVNNGTYLTMDTITKTYGQITLLLNDPCDDMGNWTSSLWDATSSSYHSAPKSITDSPSGEYSSGANNPVTISSPIDLSTFGYAELQFWAKWDIESGWDYAQVLISDDNGSNWYPLSGQYTKPGSGSFQPTGEPIYDGVSEWVQETVVISDYLSDQVLIRFELHSDGMIEEDGFYFDDLQIYGAGSSGDLPVQLANPIPDMGYASTAPNLEINLSQVFHDPNGDAISYTLISNSNSSIVNPTIETEILTLDFIEGTEGNSTISIEAEANGTTADDEFILHVGPEGIQVNKATTNLQVLPNPAKDYISFSLKTGKAIQSIKIIDLCGKSVFETQEQTSQISIQNLERGIYLLKVVTEDNHTYFNKFIKK